MKKRVAKKCNLKKKQKQKQKQKQKNNYKFICTQQ